MKRPRGRIRTRILGALLLLLLLPLSALNWVVLVSSLDSSRTQILSQLSSVASLKENAILSWEKQLSTAVGMIRARENLGAPGVTITRKSLQREILLTGLFEELFLVDPRGGIQISTEPRNEGKILSDKEYFEGLFRPNFVSAPFYDLTTQTMRVVAAAPIFDPSGTVAGSLAGTANLDVLDQLMSERTGLGRTGDTYLVGVNGILVTPSRTGNRNDVVQIPGVDQVIISKGTQQTSYRSAQGVDQVATFRWVHSLKVVLVAELQQDEAYAPGMGILAVNLGLEAVFVLLALILALAVGRGLAKPIDDLAQTALGISGGDLERNAREDGPLEVALLGQAFNAMTRRLRGSIAELTRYKENLEHLVADRTADLEEARDRAEAADRLKSSFLATMSHELRTPLNSIIGFTGILAQGLVGPLNDEQKKQLGFVMTSARHLLDLISDILDISKIEAGELKVDSMVLDLGPLVTKAVKSIDPLSKKKGLTLVLVPPAEPLMVRGDPRRVEQVLLNLLSNAIKFTETGGVTVTFLAETDRAGVAVADTGSGIGPEDLPKLFRPFQQLDSGLNRLHQGTGLGLSICRKLLDLMGGTIEVTSTLGTGSVFSFQLPRGNP